MIIFNADLDNTLIYSYKHDIGPAKRNVEIYQGREVSFITDKSYELLQKVKKEILIVPTSTRTIEQYERINLGIGNFKYALVCNGGVLLVDGVKDERWYQESLRLVSLSTAAINTALKLLEGDWRRKFELRLIENLFIFTKCNEPEKVVFDLKAQLNTDLVDVFNNGEKVYVIPSSLNKGAAIGRLRAMLKPDFVVAAGDSEFDISMVVRADRGFVPDGFKKKYGVDEEIHEVGSNSIFSEAVLEECIKIKAELS
ncbi:MAG: HAD hydrolase family protein [Lachnospiraceae bacterium]|nr:HAD hydrolase family protein [Lachnospiraceae bacterium]